MRYFNQPGTTRVIKTESASIRGKLKRRGWVHIKVAELNRLMPSKFSGQFRSPSSKPDTVYYFSPGLKMYGQSSADDKLLCSGERAELLPSPTGRIVK